MPLSQYKISSKSTSRFKRYTHLKSLNFCHCEIVEATRLKNMASRSLPMSLPPFKISSKSTNWFKFAPPQNFKRPPFWSDRRHLQCHHLHTKIHPNPPISGNIIMVFLCTHLRNLNFRHFRMVEGTGLENVASRSS
jgi:hypothetical protein